MLSWGHITSVVRGIQRNLEPISVDMRCVLDMTSTSKQPRCSTHAYVDRLQGADINISALTHIWPAPVPPLALLCLFHMLSHLAPPYCVCYVASARLEPFAQSRRQNVQSVASPQKCRWWQIYILSITRKRIEPLLSLRQR